MQVLIGRMVLPAMGLKWNENCLHHGLVASGAFHVIPRSPFSIQGQQDIRWDFQYGNIG